MISLPKLHMSNPSNNKSYHFPCTSVARLKPYFEYKTIYTISKPCVVAASSSLKQAMHSQITPPRKKIPHKELADKTSRKITSPDLAATEKTTMSTRWTVAVAVAAVASWKTLMQENQEAKSAGNASRHSPSCF